MNDDFVNFIDKMNQLHSISILPNDAEKQPSHLLEGYPSAAENGFVIGKDTKKVVEVIEIQGEQFRRHLPPIPPHSKENFVYSSSNESEFPCCNYQEKVLFTGVLEEERVLELRLNKYRKQVGELRELTTNMRSKLNQIDELTKSGDIAQCFQSQEQLHSLVKKATEIIHTLLRLQDGNNLLVNTLEFKMKAAGEIAEYQQAQAIKVVLEQFKRTSRSIIQSTESLLPQTVVEYGESLETALQLCNYLADYLNFFPQTEIEKLREPSSIYKKEDSVAIAVDLGCEFTKVSYWNFEDGSSSIIRINGCDSIPTAIAYSDRKSFIIGEDAIRYLQKAPKQVILHFPHLFNAECEKDAVDMIQNLSVSDIIQSESFTYWHIISNNESIKLSLKDVTCDFLSYILAEVMKQLQKSVSTIFIVNSSFLTVTPKLQSFFTDVSSTLATPIELIASPTSMCLSYGFFEENVKKNLLLIDFAWSHVTLQVLENGNNSYTLGPRLICDVLSGQYLTSVLYDHALNKIPAELRPILSNDYITKNKILLNIYRCLNHTKKIVELSKSEMTIPQDKRVSFAISSKAFKNILMECIEKFDQSLTTFFENHHLDVDSFDDVLISGGVANCNYVYDFIQKRFPNIYFPDLLTIYNPHNNANESVLVTGAAIQCAHWMGLSLSEIQSLLLIDLLPHDIFVKSGDDYEVVIPKGCSIPAKKTVEFEVEEGQEELMVEVYRKKEHEDYTKLGEFEFQLNTTELKESTSVGVAFTISENGGISAKCTGSYEPEVNTTNVIILLVALCFLIAAYFFLKVYFRDTRIRLGASFLILYGCLLTNNSFIPSLQDNPSLPRL